MFIVGLTGGIASGKSTVSGLFRALGVPCVDTDALAREVVAPGSSGLEAVRAAFGDDVITKDGQLDRAQLRARVFRDRAAKAKLEGILHPLIRERLQAWTKRQDYPYVIWEVPLLLESGLIGRVDRVLVVDVTPESQIERIMARDGGDRAAAKRILANQASRQVRLDIADDVISNEQAEAVLKPRVDALHQQYLSLASDKMARTP